MKKIFALTGLACVLLLPSCLRDSLDGGKNSSSTLSITVSLDDMNKEAATRGSVNPEDGEEQVNTLYLYFFESSDSRSGVFVDYIRVDGPLSMNSKYALQTAGTSISVSNAYNVIAIANIDDNKYISGNVDVWNTQWNGKTEEYFRANAFAGISGIANESDYTKVIANEWIPMNGFATKKAMSGDISMTLVRNVARFDVINNINTSYDLETTSIWNAYTRSSITGDGIQDYSKTLGLRTERFYGVDNTGNTDGSVLGNIMGGLYAFENKVTSPSPGDQHTTCLIIGLRNKTNGKIGYYRVNVHPNESAQNLKRNNVYKVTITGVTGEGATSESDAYAGTKNELEYAINYWDLDDNGMIVSDQYSILAIPVKTVRIGADGGDFSYTITTFSSLASPSPLAVKSQTYDPSNGKISASLSGATLTIHAQNLALGEGNRTGIITISYAGLEAYINVVQSESVDTYLNVTLEDTWAPKLGSTAGISSEYIYVKASGTWTAELFGDGFSFSNSGGGAVTTLSSTSVVNSKFHVYTHTQNDTGAERKAFILISLDSDPVNYISVVPVYQKVVGAINISPDAETISFNGSKEISAPYTGNNTFTVSSVGGSIVGFTLTGPDAGKFTVTLPTGSSSATMTVTANELNTSGNTYTATLRIADDTGAEKFVTLRQTSLSLTVSPGTFATPILAVGGQTDLISVSTGDASSQFTATISTASSTSGKTLYNHAAYFVDESGNPIDLSVPRSVTTKFKVAFPKVYFPNREIGITATITVNVAGSSLSRTITVNQAALTAKTVSIWNSSSGWGALNSGYGNGYNSALSALGYTWTNAANTNGNAVPPAATTYIHTANNTLVSSFNWTNIENFRTEKDGILVLMCDDFYETALGVLNASTSPLRKNGYVVTGNTPRPAGNVISLDSNLGNSRVGQFLTVYGVTPISLNQITTNFYADGTYTALTTWPETAIPIMRRPDGNVVMAIDPRNKLVYLGECQVFYTNAATYTSGGRGTFRNNYIQYVINAAKYGSHFTDMLRDDLTEIPAMWDAVWGANKWPENK